MAGNIDWSLFDPTNVRQLGDVFNPQVIAQKQNALMQAQAQPELLNLQLNNARRANISGELDLTEKQRQINDAQRMRDILRGNVQQNGTLPQSQNSTIPVDSGNMSVGQPQAQPAPQVQRTVGTMQNGEVTGKAVQWKRYSDIADQLASQGLIDQSQQYYKLAESVRPELKEIKNGIDPTTNQPVEVKYYKDGSMEVSPYNPIDKVEYQSNGQTLLPKSGLTGLQRTDIPAIKEQVSPNTIYSTNRMLTMQGLNNQGQLDSNGEQMAQAIANGQLAPLSGFALNRPGGRALMSRVIEINPSFSGQDYGVSNATEKAFTTGKQGQTIRSMNVAMNHLDTLGKLSDALNNGDVVGFNKLANIVSTQTGQPAPVNFNAAKKLVGDEIVKAIVGSGGGVSDREEAAKTIDAAKSPQQLAGVIATYKELFNGQLKGLHQQYVSGGGHKDFNTFTSQSTQNLGNATSAPTNKTTVTNW